MAAPTINGTTTTHTVYNLNTARGITNIGRHPENDIVIQDPSLKPFHLMIDHRQKPYRLIILSPDAEVCIQGVRLAGSDPKEVLDLNQIQIGGYVLRTEEGSNGSPVERVSIIPLDRVAAFPAGQAATRMGLSLPGLPGLGGAVVSSLPADPTPLPRADDVILVELAEPAAAVNVDQTAVYRVLVINGGPIVASFDVSVEGVPAEWVEIFPARFNLNEGARTTTEVRITPPRAATSLAKTYPLKVTAASPNYLGVSGSVQAELTVNPYFEFVVGSIFPYSKSLPYRKRAALTSFPITNFGNSPASFLVSAQDEENGCHFSFPLDEQVNLVKQAEIKVEPGQAYPVPVQIRPIKRKLVRLRGKQYPYTVAVQSLDAPETIRTISGALVSRAMFGLFSVLLALALVILAGYYASQPKIDNFSAHNKIIRLGEPAVLLWKVSPFATSLQIPEIKDPIKASQKQVALVPENTASTYTLVASNWLSRMLRTDRTSSPVTVLAIPSYPEIGTFFVDRAELFEGDDLTIKWSTTNAQEVFLTVEGVTESLKEDEFNGERIVKIKTDTLVILEARNNSGSVTRSSYIHALVPDPKIVSFEVTPTTVTKGEPITISWEVAGNGIESITISPFKDALPNTGQLTFYPEASMEFVLTVKSRGDKQLQPEMRSVGVLGEAVAPKVNFFKVVPEKLTSPGTVELSWSITGATTDIVLTSLEGEIEKGLPPQGFKKLTVSASTSLMLTAYNGKLSAAESLEIEVSSLKQVRVSIMSVVPSASLRVGNSVFVQVDVRPLDSTGKPTDPKSLGYPEVSGKVTITNGFDTCDVDLPATGCPLTFTKIIGKPITATYLGDDNYARTTSDPYTSFSVIGNPAKLAITYSPNNAVVGQSVTISFTVLPDDPNQKTPVTGKVDVLEGGKLICSNIDLVAGKDGISGVGNCPPMKFATPGLKTFEYKFWNSDAYALINVLDANVLAGTERLTVAKAATETQILSDLPSPTVTGQPFKVEVSVRVVIPGTGTPTEKVTVKDQANPTDFCTVTLTQGRGECSLTLNKASPVDPNTNQLIPRTLVAEYPGETGFEGSTATKAHLVNKTSTQVVISQVQPASGGANTQVGQTATVQFDVTPISPGTGKPTGRVEIKRDGVTVCQVNDIANIRQCSFVLSQSGTFALTAVYTPVNNPNFVGSESGSLAYLVQKARTAITITKVEPAITGSGEPFNVYYEVNTALSGSISLPSGNLIMVRGDPAGTETSVTCSFNPALKPNACQYTLNAQGQRQITVSFLGDSNFDTSEAILAHTVLRLPALNIWTFQTNPIVGQEVTFSYSVTPSEGTGTPTGTISVRGQLSGSSTWIPCNPTGTNSCKIAFSQAGAYTVRMEYSGDSVFAPGVKDYAISVSKAPTAIPDLFFSDPVQVDESFILSFQVINTATSIIPTGTAYITTHNHPTDPCDDPNLTKTGSNSLLLDSTGSGAYELRISNAGSRWITVYYGGGINFYERCKSKTITVNP